MVAFIEDHYIHERGLTSDKTVDFLRSNYLDKGRLGKKSANGGFYPPAPKPDTLQPKLLVLDVRLGQPLKDKSSAEVMSSGRILELPLDGQKARVLVDNLPLPDGIDISKQTNRIYQTNMGVPNKNDGTVMSANLGGTDIKMIVAPRRIYTPKQLYSNNHPTSSTFPTAKVCASGVATSTAPRQKSL